MSNRKIGLREKLKAGISFNVPYKCRHLYVWGIGNTALLYQEGLKRLQAEGMEIEGYIDSRYNTEGGDFCAKPVYPPDFLLTAENSYVLICTPQPQIVLDISRQLEQMQVEYSHIDRLILGTHMKEVLQCFDMMEDEFSMETYCEVILARVEGRLPDAGLYCENQYMALPDFARYDNKEVFVDCGAYVGDTIEQFIKKRFGVFDRIIAFEPDQRNYMAAMKRVSRLKEEWGLDQDKIIIYPHGVSDRNRASKVQGYDINKGLGSKLMELEETDTGEVCKTFAIDHFLEKPFTFLKADIESYEYKMLLGAEKSLMKYKPKLAICIYHNAVDLYSIPLLIKKIVPEYRIACRHHSYELYDTVLYAWV